ncbi:MAG: serine/threonine-protein kinase PknK [Deltaproteobacteria bacterium]|nr:serine/threonine-protein kinase PknK [Deltaproteobacteria bacterium]
MATSLDHFEVLHELGAGSMGVVSRARDRRTGEEIAIKRLHALEPGALVALKSEFRLFADVRHRNVVRLDELIEDRGQWLITMELILGETFVRWVRGGAGPDDSQDRTLPGGAIDLDRLRAAFGQLVDGLEAIHGAERVHRDLKPSNVLVERNGRVVILDFGLAEHRDATRPRHGSITGTIGYMAPEVLRGGQVGAKADWYAVGVLLYECLTGRLPFDGAPLEVMHAKLERAPVAPSVFAPVPDDLEQLCLDLLAREPERRPGAREVRAQLGGRIDERPRRRAHPLIGRDALLARAIARAGEAPSITAIVGAPGMGKTSIAHALAAQLRRDLAATCLTAACHARESIRFNAFDGIADGIRRALAALPEDRRAALLAHDDGPLGELFPVLRTTDEDGIDESVTGEVVHHDHGGDARRRAFAAFRALLADLATAGLVALVIDDVHRADRDSLDLLAHVFRDPAPPLALFVIGAREGLAPLVALADDRRVPELVELVVEPLAEADGARLAEIVARDHGMTIDPAALARAAAGHPALIVELARRGGPGDGIPSLPELLAVRLEALPPIPRALLDIVALAGGPLELAVAARAIAQAPAATRAAIETLVDAGLVAYADRGDLVAIVQDELRRIAIAQLAADQLRLRHKQLALALDAVGGVDPERVLHHWRASGRRGKAAEQALACAQASANRFEVHRAARLYQEALEGGLERKAGFLARVALGEVLAIGGRGREAATEYLTAAAIAKPGDALTLRQRAAAQLFESGDNDRAAEVLSDVLEAVDLPRLRGGRRSLASAIWSRARLRARGLRPANGTARVADRLRLDACWTAATSLSTTEPIAGLDYQTRYLRLALDHGTPSDVIRGLTLEASYVATAGERHRPRARALLDQAEAIAAQAPDPLHDGWLGLGEGVVDFMTGHAASATAACDRAVAAFDASPTASNWERRTARLFAMWPRYYLGDMIDFAGRVRTGLSEALAIDDHYSAVQFRVGLANAAWLAIDEVGAARHHTGEGMAAWTGSGYQLPSVYRTFGVAQLHLYADAAVAALEVVTRDVPAFRAAGLERLATVGANLSLLEARCALAGAADGVPHARRALARARRFGVAWGPASAHLIEAAIALATGDRIGGLASWGEAERAFTALGMRAHAAVARWRRGAAIGGPTGDDLADGADTELRILGIKRPDRWVAMIAPLARR